MKIQGLLFLVSLLFVGCVADEAEESPVAYNFLVAGHTYGHPQATNLGLYPPFVNQTDYFNQYDGLDLGFFTGDVVRNADSNNWNGVRADISDFDFPIHIAAGNHDRGELFNSLYEEYYSFWRDEDLFIILSPLSWSIVGDQLDFLKAALADAEGKASNVFIFVHELIWWSPDNRFKNVKINFPPYYPGETNYWSELSPLIEGYAINTVIYAGDLGATDQVDAYFYHQYENITLIASGMGGGKADNVILTEVRENGELDFKLLSIDESEPVEFADLTSYSLP